MENASEWTAEVPRPWSGEQHDTTLQEATRSEVPASHKRIARANRKKTPQNTRNSVVSLALSPSPQHSRKSSRAHSRNTRNKQRMENLIGREYSLINEGDAMSVRVTTLGNRETKTSSKIWIEKKNAVSTSHEYEDEYLRRSQTTSPNTRLSSREVHFDSRAARETLLFSRDQHHRSTALPNSLSDADASGAGAEVAGSLISARNVVQKKRQSTNLTAKLFQEQIDRLSMDTERTQKKYGQWKPKLETAQRKQSSPIRRYESKPRRKERLTTPLSGSGLMGAELEQVAVDVVLSRHSSRNHQRLHRDQIQQQQQHHSRLLTHDVDGSGNGRGKGDRNGAKEEEKVEENESQKPLRVPMNRKTDAAAAAAAPPKTIVEKDANNSNVTVVTSTMTMNFGNSLQDTTPTPTIDTTSTTPLLSHPGQATFIHHPQQNAQPSLQVGTIRGTHRNDGVPPMGEYYKSQSHNLAMLKRTIGKKNMPLQHQLSLSPTTDPRKTKKKNKHSNFIDRQKQQKEQQKKKKLDHNDPALVDGLMRPKGWSSPMFMLPSKSKLASPSRRGGTQPQQQDNIMTPRSRAFVSSLGGPGLIGATERALKRSVPHHQSGSLESGSSSSPSKSKSSKNVSSPSPTTPLEPIEGGSVEHIHSNVHGQHHDEESTEYSQFRTVSTATKFWLQHMLREHQLRKGLTQDVSSSARPRTPAVKNLSQFLSSAIEHIRWSCTAAGWDAPQQKELERRVYNVVLDELSDQVASHQHSRGTLFSIIATHYHEVLGQTLPSVLAKKEDLLESLREQVEALLMENRHLRREVGLEEGDHTSSLDRLADVEELRNELSAARQVIRARDAEQGALRRRAEHFRRDLCQAEALAKQQTSEVDLIRQQLKNETQYCRVQVKKSQDQVSGLRNDLIQAQSKVVHYEKMEEIRMEENVEGRIQKAEEDVKLAYVVRDKALTKAKNATKNESVLYDRIKDMEEEKVAMKREIIALTRFKKMMNEMMGKVETVRRASIAIRHKIPVSKLSGDPAVMQEVVNRMTSKVVEMEKEMEDVLAQKNLLMKKYKAEKQKCNIQTQMVIDAKDSQTKAETSLLDLHEEFAEVVSSTRDIIDDLKDKVATLESENEYLMEAAMNGNSDDGSDASQNKKEGGLLNRAEALKMSSKITSIKNEHLSIQKETRLFLNEYSEMLNDITQKVKLMGRPGGSKYDEHVMDQFASAILSAGTVSETSPIARRSSLVKRRAKAEIRKKVKQRRASMRAVMKVSLKNNQSEKRGKDNDDNDDQRLKSKSKATLMLDEDEEDVDWSVVPMEETEEFQLALTLKVRTMERDQRHIEARLRKLKSQSMQREKEIELTLIEMQSKRCHLEEKYDVIMKIRNDVSVHETEKKKRLEKAEVLRMKLEDITKRQQQQQQQANENKEKEDGGEGEGEEMNEEAKEKREKEMEEMKEMKEEKENIEKRLIEIEKEEINQESLLFMTKQSLHEERMKHDDITVYVFFLPFIIYSSSS